MKVAVLGAGTMGSGIAQVFAAKGHTALMYASSTASAQRHKDKLAASLNKKVAKGRMTQEAADDIMSRVLVEEFDAAADADLVIECVAENMAVKKELLAKLDETLSDRVHTIRVLLPYDKLGLAAPMRERGSVQLEEYREDGLYLEGIVKTEDLHCFEGYLV